MLPSGTRTSRTVKLDRLATEGKQVMRVAFHVATRGCYWPRHYDQTIPRTGRYDRFIAITITRRLF